MYLCFYRNDFRSIYTLNESLDEAELIWNNIGVTFLDGLTQMNILQQRIKPIEAQLSFIKKLTVDKGNHYKYV